MNESLRNSAAHVFVADLRSPELDDETVHHLRDVLRLRDGETVTVGDGRGSWRLCRFAGDGRLDVKSDVATTSPRTRKVSIAMVPVKGDRTEWAAEKLVELGVDEIILLAPTRRAVVRWDDDKWSHQEERYGRILLAAARQSRCLWLPTLRTNVDMSALAKQAGVAVADIGATPFDGGAVNTVVIGPEGGFDPDEIEGTTRVELADGVLRAETAAIVAATHLVAHLPR
jgi:16S rRNA (uracil1498-N3)-methyltransferase